MKNSIKKLASLVIAIITIAILSVSVFAISPTDKIYNDPKAWTDITKYSAEDIENNNQARWNITQYMIDYEKLSDDIGNEGVEPQDVPPTNVVLLDGIEIPKAEVIKPNTLVKDSTGTYSRDEYLGNLSYTTSTAIVVAFSSKELKMTANEKYSVVRQLDRETLISAYKDLTPKDQILLMTTDQLDMERFPIEYAMMEYCNNDLLEMWNAAKACDNKKTADWNEAEQMMKVFGLGSDFDMYRMMINLSRNQPKDVSLFKTMANLSYNPFNPLTYQMDLVLDTNGDMQVARDEGTFTAGYFYPTVLNHTFETDDEYTKFTEGIYTRVINLKAEVKDKFPVYN